jgi:DNA-binding MarR family transcriptional regulator
VYTTIIQPSIDSPLSATYFVNMNLDLASTLLKSGDAAQRQSAARSLGRNLSANGAGTWLRKLQRLAVKLGKETSSEYERGFLEAMELVAEGYELQASETSVDEQELARIKSRAHWLPTLQLLARGPLRPLDLSTRLNIHKSQVTRLIDDLEESKLVERAQEGKERPCRLTPHARVALSKLPAEVAPASTAKLVSAVLRCASIMGRDQRVATSRLLGMLQLDLEGMAPRVLDLIEASLRHLSLGFRANDGVMVETDGELRARISLHLAMGCSGKESALVETLQTLTEERPLVIRVGECQQEWDVLASKFLKKVLIFREKDLRFSPAPKLESYGVLYESPALLTEDRSVGRSAFIDDAQERYCLSVDDSPPMQNVQMIPVPAARLAA